MHVIKTDNQLKEVFTFLQSGYSMNTNKLQNFRNLILKTNSKNDFYGCYQTLNGTIIGAILLYYQGQTEIDKVQKKIINMSCLYFSPSHRGPKVIKFLKDVTNHFSEYIITNNTATSTVAKMLLLIGFKGQPIYRYRIFSKNFFKRCNLKSILTEKKINIINIFQKIDDFTLGLKNTYLYLNNKKLKIYFYNTFFKIFGLNFNVPVIVWTDDMQFLKDNPQYLLINLMLKFKTFFIMVFMPGCNLNIKPTWYVYCDNNYNSSLLVSPIASELEVNGFTD